MKQILLAFILCCFFIGTSAYENVNKKNLKQKNAVEASVFDNINGAEIYTGNTAIEHQTSKKIIKSVNLKAPVGTVVGNTTYDLQSNSGMCRRVATHRSGRWTYLAWTMGKDYPPPSNPNDGNPNRGTGFNYYDRLTGQYLPSPALRIEPNERVGWPTIGFSQGRQYSITHSGAGMMFAWRPGNTNLNDWNEVGVGELVNDESGVWARAASDDGAIYVIIGRQFEADSFDGIFGGIYGGLHFIRSLDNGNTWTSLGSLEADYKNSYPFNMSADDYQIDAKGEKIVVIYGGTLTSVILYTSENKGDNWTKKSLVKTSNPLIIDKDPSPDITDYSVDAYFGSDGGNSVILDSNGKTHVVYSGILYQNPASQDHAGSGRWFPFVGSPGALFYWNEDMAAPQNIGKANLFDNNEDGALGSLLIENHTKLRTEYGRFPFYSNLICHPQLGIDVNDNLYLSYAATVDGDYVPDSVEYATRIGGIDTVVHQKFPSQTINYYDVFMVKSNDGGVTWQGPLNVTDAADSEEVYPSIAKNIMDTIYLLYQHDKLPGNFLQGPQENATVNEMAVAKIHPDEINDGVAPPDSEPILTVFATEYDLPAGCSISNSTVLAQNSWILDYPEGLLDSKVKIWEEDGIPDFSEPGKTQKIAIYAEDAAGNQSDTVHVSVNTIKDEVAPAIVLDSPCNQFDVLVGGEWTTPDVIVTDLIEVSVNGVKTIMDSDCDVSENLEVNDNVDPTTIGTYNVTYSVTDFAENDATLVLNVNVIEKDTVPPVIETNMPEEVGLFLHLNTRAWQFIGKDNVDCTNVTVSEPIGIEAIDNEQLGEYEVTVTATDQSGNSTTQTFVVKVVDQKPPQIRIDNHALQIELSECGTDNFMDEYVTSGITANDDVDGVITDKIVATVNYGETIDCSAPGEYFVDYTVTDNAGNVSTAVRKITIGEVVSIAENSVLNGINIFPNPTKGILTIETQNLIVNEINVYNVIGKNVLAINGNSFRNNNKLDLSNQPEGIYMVNINTNEGAITKKVIINR